VRQASEARAATPMSKDWYEVVDADLTEARDLLRRNEADGSGVEAVRKFVGQASRDD
jgi:hypothetical protein